MRVRLAILALLLTSAVHAEHLFELGVHGGLSGWAASTNYVHSRPGFQGGAQLYYNYLSPRVVGFRTGLCLDNSNAALGRLNYEDAYSTIDSEKEQMDIAYNIGNLHENYSSWSVGIPLQISFSESGFLCLIGAKAVFPFTTFWKQNVEHAALSVYYPKYDNKIEESYPLACSRDFAMSNQGSLQMAKVQWWLAAELSYIIPLHTWSNTHRSYVIVGAYFDYCLTPYTPTHSNAESLIMLTDTRDGFPLQRLLTPVMEANRQGQPLVNTCTLFEIGIKLSYALSPYDAGKLAKKSCNCLH